jgi:hypothetical protein
MHVSGQSDRLIPPGKSEEVVINLATGPVRGKLKKVINVVTNDRATPSLRLECEAEIRSALTCEPNMLALGSLKRDAPKIERTVRITRGSAGPIKPRVMHTTNPLVKAELREIEAGSTYDLDVVAEPPWPNGTLRAAVQIETGVSEVPTETVMVTAMVTPRIQAVPGRFYVRSNADQTLRLTARLRWDESPGKATGVSVNDAALTARLEQIGADQVVVLTAERGYRVPGGRLVQVTVKTDDPAVPILQIPVSAAPASANVPAAPRTEVLSPQPVRTTNVRPKAVPRAGLASERAGGTQAGQ